MLELSGAWNLRSLERKLAVIAPRLAECAGDRRVPLGLERRDVLDHAGAMLLWRAWGRRRAENVSCGPNTKRCLPIWMCRPRNRPLRGAATGLASVVASGNRMLHVLDHLVDIVMLLGQVVLDAMSPGTQPARIPWREISASIYRIGTQALGITALVGFLIGVVLSYLSAEQLKAFGANIFIINILGMGIIRELGPVLAAVLVAGRSGSAITAQLGVMRVTEELDALSVMGIPHTVRLILPKIVALAIAMPLLILWTCGRADRRHGLRQHASSASAITTSCRPARRGADRQPVAGLGKGVVFGR